MNHNKEDEAGYNEAPKFGPSERNTPMGMFDNKYDLQGREFIKPDKKWEGIVKLGNIDGVDIFYDQYHPDQTLTVELNKDKTEMVYIISPYDDISIFEGIKKNIIVSEKPKNMMKETYSIPIYENGVKTEWTVDGIVGDEKYFKLLELGNGKDLPDMINTTVKKR